MLGQKEIFRKYRLSHQEKAENIVFQVVIEESDLWISLSPDYEKIKNYLKDINPSAVNVLSKTVLSTYLQKTAYNEVLKLRNQLQTYITMQPEFLTSLHPVNVSDWATELIKDMAVAGKVAGVGPFAAVAGGIAQAVAKTLFKYSREVLVENGGDIFIYAKEDKIIGLLAAEQGEVFLGLKIKTGEFPLSICASSATIGHSLSFGKGDLLVVLAKQACIADAFATSLCNKLQAETDVERVLNYAKTLKKHQVIGVFVQYEQQVGFWGKFELVNI